MLVYSSFGQLMTVSTRPSEAGGGAGGLEPPPPPPIISICIRQSKTLRPVTCEPNLDLLKKMKEPRLALSMLLAHKLQATGCISVFLAHMLQAVFLTRCSVQS